MAPTIWQDSLTSHKERQREQILRAAADIIAERGAANVAMSALARRAGVARATLYNYFPDIERVIAALVADQAKRFRHRLDLQLAKASSPSERLRRYLVAVHDWAAQRGRSHAGQRDGGGRLSPHLFAVIHEPLTDLRELLTAILTEGVSQQAFAADIDPPLHAEMILGLLTDPTAGGPAARDHLVRFIERGLTAAPRGDHRQADVRTRLPGP
jgi:AcrR family transcriptional regulator